MGGVDRAHAPSPQHVINPIRTDLRANPRIGLVEALGNAFGLISEERSYIVTKKRSDVVFLNQQGLNLVAERGRVGTGPV
jgi:histidinol phosphatase-like enzyme